MTNALQQLSDGWYFSRLSHRENIRRGGAWPRHPFLLCALKTRHISLGRALPRRSPRVKIGALSHRMPLGIVVQEPGYRARDGIGMVKLNDHPAPIGKELLCMPVWRGDNRFSRTRRNCQCAGNNLGFMAIGSDVDIRSGQVLN